MDYIDGGDLRFHLNECYEFDEYQTKFITACIIIALQESHKNNIIHRDLKPENLIFNSKGYLFLTDFGIARYKSNKDNSD